MKKILTLVIGLLSLIAIPSIIYAQSTIDLTISPPTQEINVKPGMKTRVQVKFFNRSSDNIAGTIKTADFVVTDKSGGPNILDTSSTNNRYAASKWLTVSESQVSIPANTPYTSTVFIDVPENTTGCGHYAAIYFEPIPAGIGSKKTGSAISFKLASLIYFNVEGKCNEKAYLNKIVAPVFLEYGPIPVKVEVLNRSDYHVAPQGYVNIINLISQQTDLQTLTQNNIFPDAIREYDLKLGSKWMFGRYKINFSAGYGKTGQTLTGYAYAWVFPWRVALIIILTFVLLVIIIHNLYQRLVTKESVLEKEIEKEKTEIEKLKEELRRRKD